MMKKWLILLLVFALMAACLAHAEETAVDEPAVSEASEETGAPDEPKAPEPPYLVTTCGQSPGAVMASMSCMQAGVAASYKNDLTAEDIASGAYPDVVTLIVTTGTSMKGMGAAGTDVDAEIARCVAVIEAAREAGWVIVGAHIEGMARRVDSTDEASINAVLPLSDAILVVEDSDSDGFFSKYAEENGLPLYVAKDALGIGTLLADPVPVAFEPAE